jgi:uncharacterized protein (UPF0303 family)
MERVCSSKTLVSTYKMKLYQKPEDRHLTYTTSANDNEYSFNGSNFLKQTANWECVFFALAKSNSYAKKVEHYITTIWPAFSHGP